ncbi:condensation domain-containing protein [Streptomyces sp. M10(2022)]
MPEQLELALDADTTASLTRRARGLGVTPSTMVQTAWALVLAQHTGRHDVVFGATVSGRPSRSRGRDDGRPVHQHGPRTGQAAPAETLADLATRVQQEQAGLMPHHHYDLSSIKQLSGLRVTPRCSTRCSSTRTTLRTHRAVGAARTPAGSVSPASGATPRTTR